MSVKTAAGTRIHLNPEPTPPFTPEPLMTQSKLIEIVVIGATGSGKSHVLELIDRALRAEYGHHVQIASHDLSCERGLGSPGTKPRVSETIFSLREQGVPADKATAVDIKAGLRTCSASRSAYLGSQLTSTEINHSDLAEAIDHLRKEVRDQLGRIHKRAEDTSALLYKWDRAGMPAARVDMDLSILEKLETTTAQLRDELSSEVRPMEAVEGVALSYCLDPLESAISLTVQALGDELSRMSSTDTVSTTTYQRLGEHLDALLAEQLKRVTADE